MEPLPGLYLVTSVPAQAQESGVAKNAGAYPVNLPAIEAAAESKSNVSPATAVAVAVAPASSSTPHVHNSPPPVQLYSPTKTEIDAHPIRQRLSSVVHNYTTDEDSISAIVETAREVEAQLQPQQTTDAMAETEIEVGDKVHWNYGSGKPTGEVAEVVTEGEAKVVSKKGNEIKKNADPENPAVKLSRPGNDVVKRASELEIDEKGDKAAKDAPAEKEEEEAAAPAENGADEAKTGEKRKADDEGAEDEEKKDDEDEEPAAAAKGKKQKTAKAASATNGEKKDKAEPKKKGRPAAKEKENGGAEKKDTKAKRAPKKAATESGEPRRSGRNAK